MHSWAAFDCSRLLELIAATLSCTGEGFPDATVTGLLREMFQAEFACAGNIDFRGTLSRRWAESPKPIPLNTPDFHQYAVRHPLVRAHRRNGVPTPLRLSDLPDARPTPGSQTSICRVLTLPLTVTSQHLCGVALIRSGPDFSALDVRLACQLQPIFGGLYALRGRLADHGGRQDDSDIGVRVTFRELAVLDLMADGLIAVAIAHHLGISPRTVSRHMESIYRKLGAHDRTTAVLRGQAMGLLPARSRPAVQPEPDVALA